MDLRIGKKRLKIKHNKRNQQFEVMQGDHQALLVYRIHENQLVLMHTKVPEAMKGQGIGKALVLTSLKFGEEQNLDLKIYCPFVKHFIEKHPDWKEMTVELS